MHARANLSRKITVFSGQYLFYIRRLFTGSVHTSDKIYEFRYNYINILPHFKQLAVMWAAVCHISKRITVSLITPKYVKLKKTVQHAGWSLYLVTISTLLNASYNMAIASLFQHTPATERKSFPAQYILYRYLPNGVKSIARLNPIFILSIIPFHKKTPQDGS